LLVPTEIDRHEVQRLMGTGAQLVDVMPKAEWDESHITGAVHVPLTELADLAPERLDQSRPVIVYCYDSL
jgi:rhodanese-related sulfurtransferase